MYPLLPQRFTRPSFQLSSFPVPSAHICTCTHAHTHAQFLLAHVKVIGLYNHGKTHFVITGLQEI